MTVDEKRKKLSEHCDESYCSDCKLTGKNVCLCENVHSFMRPISDHGYMTDAEIIGAYHILFGDDTAESCELDSAFECDGVHIVTGDNCAINIYKKED